MIDRVLIKIIPQPIYDMPCKIPTRASRQCANFGPACLQLAPRDRSQGDWVRGHQRPGLHKPRSRRVACRLGHHQATTLSTPHSIIAQYSIPAVPPPWTPYLSATNVALYLTAHLSAPSTSRIRNPSATNPDEISRVRRQRTIFSSSVSPKMLLGKEGLLISCRNCSGSWEVAEEMHHQIHWGQYAHHLQQRGERGWDPGLLVREASISASKYTHFVGMLQPNQSRLSVHRLPHPV